MITRTTTDRLVDVATVKGDRLHRARAAYALRTRCGARTHHVVTTDRERRKLRRCRKCWPEGQ